MNIPISPAVIIYPLYNFKVLAYFIPYEFNVLLLLNIKLKDIINKEISKKFG